MGPAIDLDVLLCESRGRDPSPGLTELLKRKNRCPARPKGIKILSGVGQLA